MPLVNVIGKGLVKFPDSMSPTQIKSTLAGFFGIGAMSQSGDAEASFIGQAAKTFSKGAKELAESMMAKGASRDAIWKETGERFGMPTYKGPDGKWRQEISDNFDFTDDGREIGASWERDNIKALQEGSVGALPQSMAMRHDDLYAAYPDLGNTGLEKFPEKYSALMRGARGAYSPDRDMIGLSNDQLLKAAYPDKVKDMTESLGVNLHELQHGIQSREGFAQGGSPDSVQRSYWEDLRDRYRRTGGQGLVVRSEELWKEQGSWNTIDTIQQMSDIRRPKDLFNSSYYYEYSDQLRSVLGAPPKRGEARNEWVRDAGQWIARKIKDGLNYREQELLDVVGTDREMVKKNLRSIEAKIKRLPADKIREARQLRSEMDKVDPNTNYMDRYQEHEMYRRLTGEAEARNVQTRLPMSMEQRIAKPPWATLDVPENELLNKFRAGSGLGIGAAGTTAIPDNAYAQPLPSAEQRLGMPGQGYSIQAADAPIFSDFANALRKVELPIVGHPLLGIADWAEGVAYQDDDRLKRAAIGALDLL